MTIKTCRKCDVPLEPWEYLKVQLCGICFDIFENYVDLKAKESPTGKAPIDNVMRKYLGLPPIAQA